MSKDKLVIDCDQHVWRISWFIAEDQNIGGSVGQDAKDGLGAQPRSTEGWEHWIASKTVREAPAGKGKPDGRDSTGFYWESKADVTAAMRLVKDAIKRGRDSRPMPEWAKQALAAGWKAPKGWQP